MGAVCEENLMKSVAGGAGFKDLDRFWLSPKERIFLMLVIVSFCSIVTYLYFCCSFCSADLARCYLDKYASAGMVASVSKHPDEV